LVTVPFFFFSLTGLLVGKLLFPSLIYFFDFSVNSLFDMFVLFYFFSLLCLPFLSFFLVPSSVVTEFLVLWSRHVFWVPFFFR